MGNPYPSASCVIASQRLERFGITLGTTEASFEHESLIVEATPNLTHESRWSKKIQY